MQQDDPVISTAFPSKPYLEEKKPKFNVWVRSLGSLALYLVAGWFLFNDRIWILLVITGIVIIHELGHFLAMKYYNYRDLGIFFIPLLGAYASGTKQEVSQKQSAVIILAGPLPGIIIGIILFLITRYEPDYRIYETARLFIFLNILNLLPVYPLDGGQLLNRVFLDENRLISNSFILVSAGALAWFAWQTGLYPLLLFPVMMLMRLWSEISFARFSRNVEKEGVNLDQSYDDISDEEYWKIRKAIIRNEVTLSDIPPGPPYEYAPKEDQVITTMQGLLQRTLITDVNIGGKILLLFIWAASIAAPFLLDIPFDYFRIYTG